MARPNRTWLLGPGLFVIALLAAGPPALPERHVLEIRSFAYEPPVLEAVVGDTLVWINHDLVPHTATAENAAWGSGDIPAGGRGSVVARHAGTFAYVCSYHPGMRGVVTIHPSRQSGGHP